MKWWLLLLLVPAVSGQAITSATMDAIIETPLQFAEIDDTLRASCQKDMILVKADHFDFHESAQEFGCAAVQLRLPIPQGATTAVASFGIDREVDTQLASGPVAVNFRQVFSMTDDTTTRATTVEPFPANGQMEARSQLIRAAFKLDPTAEFLEAGWLFDDVPPSGSATRINAGNGYKSEVRSIEFAFQGVPLPAFQQDVETDSADADVHKTRSSITFRLTPEQVVTWRPQIHMTFPTTPVVTAFKGPDGPLPLSAISITSDANGAQLSIAAAALTGAGEYHLTTEQVYPIADDARMTAMGSGFMALPIIGAVFAAFQYGNLRRQAEGTRIPTAISVWIIAAAAGYLALIIYLFTTGEHWNMLVRPMPVRGLVYTGFLAALFAAFILIGLLGTRHAQRSMKTEMDELRAMRARLERSNRDLEHFAYVASHDLQEPLRTISGFTQLMQRRYGDDMPEQAQRYLSKTVEGSKRMQILIGELLAYSRINVTGEDHALVNLNQIVHDELEDLSELIKESGTVLDIGTLPSIYAHDGQMRQLFSNLIRNAIKYRDPERAPRVSVQANLEGSFWHVTVADNGVGIPTDQFQRIFMVFQRLAPREDETGTGIGLAIVQRIVTGHGGRVWVESEVGQGSTFHFTLPIGAKHD